MKEFIGISVKFFLANGCKLEGIVLDDKSDRVLIKDEESGDVSRIFKNHIVLFVPASEPEAFIPLQLLSCSCESIGCPGVKYITEGETLTRKMFDEFMKPCPKRSQQCQCQTKGDIRTVSSKTLSKTISGMMFGDYPEVEEKKNGK